MAIIGERGRLVLKRESPLPSSVRPADARTTNSYQTSADAIWAGDQVTLTSPDGLPFLQPGGASMAPSGLGIWSSTPWAYSPGYEGIEDGDLFWAEAPAIPWAGAPPVTTLTLYAHVDPEGRIRLYDNFADAVNGDPNLARATAPVDFGEMTITNIDADWKYTCDIREWNLELDAPSVDTTGIGTKFGESVKSLITGGGEIGYYAEYRNSEERYDPTALMRLLLLTEKGCKASAQFWLLQDRDSQPTCVGLLDDPCATLAPGDIYYTADLLVVGTTINVAPANIIAGAARFVTTGEIRLKLGV
jgi:hypothetical protein